MAIEMKSMFFSIGLDDKDDDPLEQSSTTPL